MPKKYNRWVIAYLSCTHAGHELGLLNPETWWPEYHLDEDGMEYIEKVYRPLNPTQKTLWKFYTDHIDELFYITGKDKLGIKHLGDATQGVQYMDGVVYTSEGTQTVLAVNNWAPFFSRKKKPDFVRQVWGTPSHRFHQNSVPMIIHQRLKEMYPKVDVKTYRHGLVTAGGVKADDAHHGNGPGIRNWTHGNVFELYCKSLMMDDLDRGKEPPALIARSHVHTRVEVCPVRWHMGKRYRTTGIIIPSYQMMTDHAHKVTKSSSVLINGMAAVEIINGKIYDIHWLLKESDLRIEEVLT